MKEVQDMKTFYWWAIKENSAFCGEEFITELNKGSYKDHKKHAQTLFPGAVLECYGKVSDLEAKEMQMNIF